MILTDRAIVKGARITRDGYLVADALVAKANNIQEYRASELGLTDRAGSDVVRIFRPEAAVFAADALASAAHRPVTIGHPPVMVDAKNWREYARGDMGGEVVRDGEYVRVSIKMMDADAVESVMADHREFSMGYQCKLDMTPGEFGGQAYDGAISELRYNHLAACRAARGGPDLQITDERPISEPRTKEPEMTTKTITFDGLPLLVTDAAEAAIGKLQTQIAALTTAKDAAETDKVRLTAEAVAKDAQIVKLTADVEAAKITPAQMRDAAKAFSLTVAKAKALIPALTIGDDLDEAAIKKAVVTSKLGDAAKTYTDEHVGIAFDTLTAGVKIGDGASDPIVDAYRATDSRVTNIGDAAARERAAYEKSLTQFSRKKSA